MLKLKQIFYAAILLLINSTAFGEFPEHDDYDIQGSVDMAGFLIGKDRATGSFYYIVIRSMNQCYLSNNLSQSGGGGGLTPIDCESLKKIPQIESYIKSGKRP